MANFIRTKIYKYEIHKFMIPLFVLKYILRLELFIILFLCLLLKVKDCLIYKIQNMPTKTSNESIVYFISLIYSKNVECSCYTQLTQIIIISQNYRRKLFAEIYILTAFLIT